MRKNNSKKSTIERIEEYFIYFSSLKHFDLYIFLLSCIVLITIKFIQFPSLTHNAEIFAESATNFFIHAYKDDIVTNIVTTDAGYLPIIQRLIALLLVKVFQLISLYPFFSQVIAITFIAVMSSLINLNIFRTLNPSALIRFILGIAIGLISDYELNAFINFVYYGTIILFLGIFIDKEKLHKVPFSLLLIMTILIMLSKGQFVVFIPIYLIMIFLHFRRKKTKSFIYYLFAITAGLLQLIIISLNASQIASNQKLLLLPYLIIKTMYYYILTYKHVFFGYVMKEDVNIICMGILLLLFIIGIRTIISKKNKQTLYIFFAGNFIALCSLFLTVIVLNSNVNPQIENITTTIKVSKSFISASQKVTETLSESAKREENIFDVKHFANLRSLFISNLLIFLTGVIVLLKIFSRKSHQIIFLLIIIFTSGAFGQLKVEEAYAEKSQSFSQWEIYHHLLNKEQYCIPVNGYSFLLQKNCDYLLYKNYNNLGSNADAVQTISLSRITPLAKTWEIQAVILINKPNQFSNKDPFHLYAYDKNNKIIGKARQLVPSHYEFVYYLFDKPISKIEKLSWKSSDGKEIRIIPNIIILGTNKDGIDKRVEY